MPEIKIDETRGYTDPPAAREATDPDEDIERKNNEIRIIGMVIALVIIGACSWLAWAALFQ